MVRDFINRLIGADGDRKKIARNVVWAVAGKVITLSSQLIVGIFVARYLGADQYGLMNYVISFVTLFSVISNFGSDHIIVRELSARPKQRDMILGTSFIIRLVMWGVMTLLLALYLYVTGRDFSTSAMILVYSLMALFSSFDVIRHYFTSIIDNEAVVKSEIFRTIVGVVLQLSLLLFNAPLMLFVVARMLNFALLAGGYTVSYRRRVGSFRSWSFDWTFARQLLVMSLPLFISNVALMVYQHIDKIMIGDMLDDQALGYFSTAFSFVSILTFVPTIIMQTITPLLVRYYNGDQALYARHSQGVVSITTWLMIFICTAISLLANPVIYLTYGAEYMAGAAVLQIIIFKGVGTALSMTAGHLVIIEGKQRYAVVRDIVACVVCILCNYIFIPRWGIIGSAWATIITVVIQGWLANALIRPFWGIFKIQTRALFLGWMSFGEYFNLRALKEGQQ